MTLTGGGRAAAAQSARGQCEFERRRRIRRRWRLRAAAAAASAVVADFAAAAAVDAAAAAVALGGGGGGGRRSDIRLKHDITLLGHLDNGIGFYRFSYNGSDKAYVGVMAQEVQAVMPEAVTRDREGYSAGALRHARGDLPELRSMDRIGRARSGRGAGAMSEGTEH